MFRISAYMSMCLIIYSSMILEKFKHIIIFENQKWQINYLFKFFFIKKTFLKLKNTNSI